MAEGNLQSVLESLGGRCESGEDGGEGGADVGAESERIHALETEDADADEGRESGGEDGGALNEDGEETSETDGGVSGEPSEGLGEVVVDGAADGSGDVALEHAAEKFDDEDETNDEDPEGCEEKDDSNQSVVPLHSSEDVSTVLRLDQIPSVGAVMTFATTEALDETKVIVEEVGVVDGTAESDLLDLVLVELDDELGEGIGERLEELRWLASSGGRESNGFGDEGGGGVEIAEGDFEGQKNEDAEPVEHVVDRGAGEGASELGPLRRVRHRDQRVRHRSPDVRAHHYRDGHPHGEN